MEKGSERSCLVGETCCNQGWHFRWATSQLFVPSTLHNAQLIATQGINGVHEPNFLQSRLSPMYNLLSLAASVLD